MAKSFFELLKTKKENSPQVSGSTKGSAVESVAVKSEKKSSQEKPSDKKEKIFKQEELSPEEEGQLTIDVYQTERDIVIKSPVAGVRPEDLDVEIGNDMITIRGKRENEEKDIFVHFSAVKNSGLKYLKEGEQLTFEVENTDKGPSAINLQKTVNEVSRSHLRVVK